MGSYQGAVAGASLRRWKGVVRRKKKVSVCRLEQRGLNLGHLRLPRNGSSTRILIRNTLLCAKWNCLWLIFEKINCFCNPNSSPWANVCSAHKVNKNPMGALHTESQHSQRHIRIECKYWQHNAHWKIHWSGKLPCFPHTHMHAHRHSQHMPGIGKPVMKKVCACAFHERLHVWDETQPDGDALVLRQQNLILQERDEVLYM